MQRIAGSIRWQLLIRVYYILVPCKGFYDWKLLDKSVIKNLAEHPSGHFLIEQADHDSGILTFQRFQGIGRIAVERLVGDDVDAQTCCFTFQIFGGLKPINIQIYIDFDIKLFH